MRGAWIIGLYVACALIANLTASTPIVLGEGFALSGGVLLNGLAFTLLDLAHERFGALGARRMVYATFGANVLLAGYAILVGVLTRHTPSAWNEVPGYLAAAPRIVVASLLAYLVASLVDVRVFGWWRRYVRGPRWATGTASVAAKPPVGLWGVLASNAVSTLLDSVVFIGVAFGLVVSQEEMGLLPAFIACQYAVKMAITLLSLPLIYVIRGRIFGADRMGRTGVPGLREIRLRGRESVQ